MFLIVGGGLIAWFGWQGRRGQLKLNAFAGIRTRTTMRSEKAWQAAHRAGGAWMIVGGGLFLVTGMGVAVATDETTAGVVALVGTSVAIVPLFVGGWLGQQAARRVS